MLDLLADRSQHPFAHRFDKPGFLQDRNEVVRRHQTALGMLPAQQRLKAANLAAAQGYLWLEVQQELFLLECNSQSRFELRTRGGSLIHLRQVELILISAAIF